MGNDQKSNQRNKSEASQYILQLQSILHISQGQHKSELYSQGNFTKWWQRVFGEKWDTIQRTASAKKIKWKFSKFIASFWYYLNKVLHLLNKEEQEGLRR